MDNPLPRLIRVPKKRLSGQDQAIESETPIKKRVSRFWTIETESSEDEEEVHKKTPKESPQEDNLQLGYSEEPGRRRSARISENKMAVRFQFFLLDPTYLAKEDQCEKAFIKLNRFPLFIVVMILFPFPKFGLTIKSFDYFFSIL